MVGAWEAALREALSAGHREYEYLTGEEYALEWAECNEVEFCEDGAIYGGGRNE